MIVCSALHLLVAAWLSITDHGSATDDMERWQLRLKRLVPLFSLLSVFFSLSLPLAFDLPTLSFQRSHHHSHSLTLTPTDTKPHSHPCLHSFTDAILTLAQSQRVHGPTPLHPINQSCAGDTSGPEWNDKYGLETPFCTRPTTDDR